MQENSQCTNYLMFKQDLQIEKYLKITAWYTIWLSFEHAHTIFQSPKPDLTKMTLSM